MKKIYACLIGIVLVFTSNAVCAVRVMTIYQGVVPVASQSVDERNKMASAALSQVLVKVSGSDQVLMSPLIKSQMPSASSLIQAFRYGVPALPIPGKPYLLQINFDPDTIDKMLRDAKVPTWGQNRPLILMWVEYEAPGKPAEIMTGESLNDIPKLLKQSADARGLPIVFPMMDVTDLNQVSVNDVVTMAVPALLNAAKRYQSDAMIIGRVLPVADGGYSTQWKLVMGHDEWGWNITGKSLSDVMLTLMNHVADALSGRYATIVTNQIQTVASIKVTGVNQQEDVADIINYLKRLPPVADVEVESASGDNVVLTISLRSQIASFVKAVSAGQKLSAVAAQPGDKATLLVYQWNH